MFRLQRLGLAEAERACDAILAALTATDNPIALAIADEHGIPILLVRQDGAPARMLSRARAKAYTAANLGLDTVAFRDEHVKAKQRTLDDWSDPLITTLQGGVAIRFNGKVVGGIAMSGNTTLRDEALARVGLQAMEFAGVITSLSVSLSDARIGVAAIVTSARQHDGPLAISVVDAGGNVVLQVRQDGAAGVDIRNAERKAFTAAYIGRDTALWRLQILHDGRTVADWANPNLTTLHGGWTLRRASLVIGGLGVSGLGDEDRDEQLALKGAEALAQLAVDEWRQKRDPRPIRARSAVRA